jgi:hypothetical protein
LSKSRRRREEEEKSYAEIEGRRITLSKIGHQELSFRRGRCGERTVRQNYGRNIAKRSETSKGVAVKGQAGMSLNLLILTS